MSDRLQALDAAFLAFETSTAHMHIGSLAIFEGGLLEEGVPFEDIYERVVELVASRIHLVPRFRQKVSFAPMGIVPPEWVDDERFDLRYHIRRVALPSPGRESQLFNLVGHIMSRPLDRRRPLWEMYLVEGLQNGRGAIVQKTHHALVDGISAVDIGTVMLDFTPNATVGDPEPWEPRSGRSLAERVTEFALERARSPKKALQTLSSALKAPREIANAIHERATGIGSLMSSKGGLIAPPSPINKAISPHRKFVGVRLSLSDLKTIKNTLGGTVNDVILSVTTGGLRHFWEVRGEELEPDTFLRALVPVSVRSADEFLALGNRVSGMMVALPLGIEDPLERYRLITESTKDLKEMHQAVGAEFLVELSSWAPPTLHAMAARLMGRQRFFNLTVSNVPGPQVPLYVLGAKLVEAYPVVPITENSALSVGVTSYNGGVYFGLNADAEALSDVHILAEGVEKSVMEYLALAG
ncbi:MAG: wax ester/triacylglycerol synthase family O-acyltransferase [Acidimicrobiia bacterium]